LATLGGGGVKVAGELAGGMTEAAGAIGVKAVGPGSEKVPSRSEGAGPVGSGDEESPELTPRKIIDPAWAEVEARLAIKMPRTTAFMTVMRGPPCFLRAHAIHGGA